MDFEPSQRCSEFKERLTAFMDEHVYPAEEVYERQLRESDDPHHQPQIMEELKEHARKAGLWNMFLPDEEHGAGLSNSDYAPLAEILGRSHIASEACNCSAPDTGNMEVLHQFGTDEQKQRWLTPLLDGDIRSAFAMTEPDVGSSDATNIEMRIERDGDEYVLNGRKWWITNALPPALQDPDRDGQDAGGRADLHAAEPDPRAARHARRDGRAQPAGVRLRRPGRARGNRLRGRARARVTNVISKEGDGFMIAQARLGPGRIHHCMRAIGAAERALEAMCRRAVSRVTFGKPLATRGNVLDWIAESRIEIEMARLLTLKAAWMMDTVGNRHARTEIAAIKVAAPNVALKVLDRAIQVHGGGGVSDDFGLASRIRAPAHAAPGRRPRRGAQALDRAPRARALHPPRAGGAAG